MSLPFPPGTSPRSEVDWLERRARPRTDTSAIWRSRRDPLLRRALAFTDLMAVTLAIGFAFLLSSRERELSDLLSFLPTLPVWLVLFSLYGLYNRSAQRVGHSAFDDFSATFHSLVVGGLLLWSYYWVISAPNLSLNEIAVFGAGALAAIPVLRVVAARLLTERMGPERVVFLGDATVIPALVRKLRAHPEYGLAPIGLVSIGPLERPPEDMEVLGDVTQTALSELVETHRIERVIVPQADLDAETMLDLVQECRELGTKVLLLPSHVEALGPSVEVDDIEGVTVLGLCPPILPRSARALKRAMDLFGSLIGLTLLAPAFAVIALAIKIDSPGPVLFKQERIGTRGRRFQLLKFRTMVADAEKRRATLLAESDDPHWLKLDHDPRITRVGRLLRLASIDELPQFWNVLRGNMSLVGPRPLIGSEDERVRGWRRARLDLAPGITGLWQVLGRTNIPFEEMIKLDYLYVTNWSLWTDVRLILRTLPAVLRGRGVN